MRGTSARRLFQARGDVCLIGFLVELRLAVYRIGTGHPAHIAAVRLLDAGVAVVGQHRVKDVLQRDYQVNVAGPSTMAALLNSLQMGFKTLAIQKRSGEVWQLLGAVKTEFDKFGQGLSKMQQRLRQTDEELDNLIGVRSRAISRKLRSVQSLDEAAAATLLELDVPLRPLSGGQLPQSGSQWQDGEL